jgi:hypothetical protein
LNLGVSRNRFCDFLADPDGRNFSRFTLILTGAGSDRCAGALHGNAGAKNASFAMAFNTENDHFYQDRLRTNIAEKALKQRDAFYAGVGVAPHSAALPAGQADRPHSAS